MMDESVNINPNDLDYLNSSIGSRSGSIEKPGIWVWLSDHLNKRRSSKKDINDLSSDNTKGSSPEIIGRSLFYLSSSWNPIEMESDLKSEANDKESPVESISKWPGSINPESTSNGEDNDDDGDQIEIADDDSNTEMIDHNGHFNHHHSYHNSIESHQQVTVSSSDEETLTVTEILTNSDTQSTSKINLETSVNLINSNNVNNHHRLSSRPVSIQRHSKRSSNCSESNGINAVTATAIERGRYEMRREKLLQELLTSEEDYVGHLASVIKGYMYLMKNDKPYPVPDDLRGGKTRIVFGNIEAIYEWHRDYMVKEVKKCVCKQSRLGPVFKRWLKKLNIYVIYCQNKNKSEFIVQQYLNSYFEDLRLHLGHQLRLPDLLIKPIQRIMKYQLILSNLLKYTQQAGLVDELNDLRSALQYMQAVPKTTNDMMALTRLAGYEGSVMAQGNLIMQGILYVGHSSSSSSSSISFSSSTSSFSSFLMESDSPSPNNHLSTKLLRSISSGSTTPYQFKKRYIFLFDKVMLICKVPKGHHAFSEYIYKFHLPMNKISALEHFPESNYPQTKFRLITENYQITGFTGESNIVFKASSTKEKDQWTNLIQNIIDRQSFFIRALVSPIVHQKSIETFQTSSNLLAVVPFDNPF